MAGATLYIAGERTVFLPLRIVRACNDHSGPRTVSPSSHLDPDGGRTTGPAAPSRRHAAGPALPDSERAALPQEPPLGVLELNLSSLLHG